MLRRETWVDDRGRVVRHGTVTDGGLANFGEIEARFQREWSNLVKEVKNAKD
jgi:hypothetical protein